MVIPAILTLLQQFYGLGVVNLGAWQRGDLEKLKWLAHGPSESWGRLANNRVVTWNKLVMPQSSEAKKGPKALKGSDETVYILRLGFLVAQS